MPAVNLGMPKVPETLAPRRETRQISVGNVKVGGNAPISVQSMTTTQTTDINGTLQQIAELTATGCDIVRVAVPTQDDANVLHIIAKKSQIPVVADIHFQPKYVSPPSTRAVARFGSTPEISKSSTTGWVKLPRPRKTRA